MTDHAANKRLVVAFLDELERAEGDAIARVLDRYCHPDAAWRIFHPFNTLDGSDAVRSGFWEPLKASFPDHEHRLHFAIADTYEDREWVATLGHVMGTFAAPWIGIPANHGLTFLRFALNARLRDGRIDKAFILLDVLDVMRQAGFYPLRRMPGSPEQWPGPPASSGADLEGWDGVRGETSLRIIREMQMGLAQGKALQDLAAARGNHSPHWHDNMNWYGPAGVGSSRGQRGFLDFHGALFIQAFPDRAGIVREHEGPDDRPGHYIRGGDGRFAVTAGWPSLYGTHLGGGWLGVPPSGRKVEMRVADWYRLDRDDKIIDNWVAIDTLHLLHQFGLDVLDDLRFIADPGLPRWPR